MSQPNTECLPYEQNKKELYGGYSLSRAVLAVFLFCFLLDAGTLQLESASGDFGCDSGSVQLLFDRGFYLTVTNRFSPVLWKGCVVDSVKLR
jgi:hypothetical protein